MNVDTIKIAIQVISDLTKNFNSFVVEQKEQTKLLERILEEVYGINHKNTEETNNEFNERLKAIENIVFSREVK